MAATFSSDSMSNNTVDVYIRYSESLTEVGIVIILL